MRLNCINIQQDDVKEDAFGYIVYRFGKNLLKSQDLDLNQIHPTTSESNQNKTQFIHESNLYQSISSTL